MAQPHERHTQETDASYTSQPQEDVYWGLQ